MARQGTVCVTLRDLTKQMVVGTYCDGDDADLNPREGRLELDLPRRTLVLDARVAGADVLSVTPRQFELASRQSVVVRVAQR